MNPAIQGEQYQRRRYKRVSANGSSFVCTPQELPGMIDDESEYTISDVWMSPVEFDALPEFTGF